MKKLLLALLMLAPMATFAQAKFGHVNTQEIMQAMPETEKARTEIEALQKQYEADITAMQSEFQKKAEAFEKEKATLPQNVRDRREGELQEMGQKIQQSYQDNQQELYKAQNEKLQAIQQKIMDAINQVANAGNYVYVMEMGSLPYISTTLSDDLTAQVKAKLGLK